MSRPLVSVHVACYNQAAFIAATLDSVVHQDYPNLQIVVGDDGSSDGTYEICAAYAARYPDRIVLLPHERCGLIPNWNRILKACTGDFVAILNGDDLFLPGKISAQVAWFEQHPDGVLCGHDTEHFLSADDRRLALQSELAAPATGAGPRHFIRRGCPFATVSVMFRRTAAPLQGFDLRMKVSVDYLFFVETVVEGGAWGHVPGVLARYRHHTANTVAHSGHFLREDALVSLALIEARYPRWADDCRARRARLYLREGVRALLDGRPSPEARRSIVQALRTAPLSDPKIAAWLAVSLLPERLAGRVARTRVPPA